MATVRSVLLVLLSSFLFSSHGMKGCRALISKEDDIELEKQLKLLNKPTVKSIHTKYGDIYDCVDFYKQPAFDHPLLINHTFHPQMRPFSVPALIEEKKQLKDNIKASGIKVLRCPSGTVPIRRVTKADLIREKIHSNKYGSKYNALTIENPGYHFAVVQTRTDPKKNYNGGGANIGIYNPSVTGSQYSSARMRIQNRTESIEIGWTVNPTLYGDNRTRLYTYLNAGQSQCFNIRCPGFVIVNSTIPIDMVLDGSQGGSTFAMQTLIFRDAPVGNWWLQIGVDGTQVGFWPQKIFTNLANLATSVEWGGEVYSPPDIPSPQMGSGNFPKQEQKSDAFCASITTINETHVIKDAVNTKEYKDINRYDVIDDNKGGPIWRHIMYFGGPGGATGK